MNNRIINLDSEYKIKIEKGNEFENSIFSDVYKQARQNVADILSHSKDKYDSNDKDQCDSKDDNKHDSYNNIIAFTGERGKGKSSTMISFLESLIKKNTKDHKIFYSDDIINNVSPSPSKDYEEKYGVREEYSDKRRNFIVSKIPSGIVTFSGSHKFSDFNFLTVDVIDPSSFRREEQLFEIIIAKLFSQFRKNIDCKNGVHNDEDRRELVKLFQTVFDDLKNINNRDEIYKQDALDALIKLSTSSNLKDSFDKLIKKYLTVFGSSDKTNFLVIAIDDFDLKIDGVYEMLEDIRQYLITKSIILLIACKMEQLSESVFLAITRQKYNGLECCLIEEKGRDSERQMTFKVIEKLIPIKRQITIPSIDDLILHNNERLGSNLAPQNKELDTYLISRIFQVFNVFISKNSYYNNVLFPQTMRNYTNLISVIDSKDKNVFQNYVLSLLKEQDNDLFIFYNTKNYTNRTTVISHFIVLLEKFYKKNKRENIENEIINSLEKLFAYDKIENFTPSILFTIFILLNEYIDKRNVNQVKTLELIKILYELDYSKTEFSDHESYKNCYFINTELLPTKLRLRLNKNKQQNRDLFNIKLEDNTDLLIQNTGDSQLGAFQLNDRLNITERAITKKKMTEKYYNSSSYISKIISNQNSLTIVPISIIDYNGNGFHELKIDTKFYIALFLESFGTPKFLEKDWKIDSFRHKYFYFNIFQLLHSISKVEIKYELFNQTSIYLFNEENDHFFYKSLNNLSFVIELYHELVNCFENYYKSNKRPFINETDENYSEYIKIMYVNCLSRAVKNIETNYKLDNLSVESTVLFLKKLFNNEGNISDFVKIINNGFNQKYEESNKAINPIITTNNKRILSLQNQNEIGKHQLIEISHILIDELKKNHLEDRAHFISTLENRLRKPKTKISKDELKELRNILNLFTNGQS